MMKAVEQIKKNFMVNGEDGKYIEVYMDKEELLSEMDEETFEESFAKVNDEQFPVVTFDESGSTGLVFTSDRHDDYDLMYEADRFFNEKEMI